ncbi:hypothetical protein AW736_20180 [Termitidicoccus mucosus]|uniref:Outer membrane protein beta-barrel domain-containing protein n=1 Tax=Termitidicoccus mucosus TaxID=1184151 RepID=A0A178IFB7_9BACT|nr:hypothetical protein AW736_20180 [Opitutaceae bacterium TSB47]
MLQLTARVTAAAFAVFVAHKSLAFVEIARGSLTAGLAASAAHDTNIFGNNTERPDEILTITPDLQFTRNVGTISMFASGGVNLIRFSDHTDQNSEDPFANLKFNYDGADKGSAQAGASYRRSSETNDAALTRTESDDYKADATVTYYYSEKLGVRPRADLSFSRSRTNGFNDVDRLGAGAGLLYRYSPKLTLVSGYDFRTTETRDRLAGTNKPDSSDHRFSFGVEGDLAPKLTGSASLGATYRDFDDGDSSWLPYAGIDLTWAASEKTSVFLTVSSDFDTTSSAQSSKNLRTALGARHALSARLSLSGSIGYEHIKYSSSGLIGGRTDKVLPLTLNLDYAVNKYLSLGAGVSWRHNSSDLVTADYDRAIYTLQVSARY